VEIPKIIIDKLKIAKNIVILSGAGMSAESGVSTFRDPDGLWAKFSPTELASMDGFMSNPQLVWDWYSMRLNVINNVSPNNGHKAVAEMEKYFDDVTVITQNVDKLHQRAGSKKVYELHGNIVENYCSKCHEPFTKSILELDKEIPKCEHCGGYIRPAVVWFGEELPQKAFKESVIASQKADIMFVIGTSGEVYPAAQLPFNAKNSGAFVVEINPNHTALSQYLDISIHEPSGVAMPKILENYLIERGRK